MRCVLHIGTEKTATTTLQRHLDHQRSALAAKGVAVTRSAGTGNNWRLAVAAYDHDRHDDRSADAGITDAESRRRFRAELVAGLKSELAAITAEAGIGGSGIGGPGIGTVLFSSEHLHSRLTKPSEIERLASLLADIGVTGTTVVVYLREPVSLAASLHSTVVKHGSARRTPPPPEPGTYYHLLCDHRGSIERWEAVFDDVVPRLFEPDALLGGSILTDFADALGVPTIPVDPDLDGGHLNRSLSTAELEVLCRINEHLSAIVDGRPNPRHVELVAALERHSIGPGYRLPPRLAERYREAFTDSNEWVRTRFFPDRSRLFAADDPDHEPKHSPPGYDGLAALVLELLETRGQADEADQAVQADQADCRALS